MLFSEIDTYLLMSLALLDSIIHFQKSPSVYLLNPKNALLLFTQLHSKIILGSEYLFFCYLNQSP